MLTTPPHGANALRHLTHVTYESRCLPHATETRPSPEGRRLLAAAQRPPASAWAESPLIPHHPRSTLARLARVFHGFAACHPTVHQYQLLAT
eukprot:2769668-Pleurochrysis_carterae.AAC.1